jgi:hypothetical protein
VQQDFTKIYAIVECSPFNRTPVCLS